MNFRPDRRTALTCVLVAVVAGGAPLTLSSQAGALVFTNITVINGTLASAEQAMTVVVRGDRIEAIGKSAEIPIPAGAQVIDSEGKFMIPGLWDMHVHLSDAKMSAIPALVANGVTSVRDMGSLLPQLDEWRFQIEHHILVGPRIVR